MSPADFCSALDQAKSRMLDRRLFTDDERQCLCYRIQIGLSRGRARQDLIDRFWSLHPHLLPAPSPVRGSLELWSARESGKLHAEAARHAWFKDRLVELGTRFDQYDALCQAEYDRVKDEHRVEFEARAASRSQAAWQYYQWLRQFYFSAGIEAVPDKLNAIVTGVRFIGLPVTGGAHPDLHKILLAADALLDEFSASWGWDVKAAIRKEIPKRAIGGFVPRPLNTETRLSPHALGRAIDVAADANPHLRGQPAKEIDKVLEWLQSVGAGPPDRFSSVFLARDELRGRLEQAVELHMKMRGVSEALRRFLNDYYDTWAAVNKRRHEAEQRLNAWKNTRKFAHVTAEQRLSENAKLMLATAELAGDRAVNMTRLVKAIGQANVPLRRRQGFYTLPIFLMAALKVAGARSGTEFDDAKDAMHFEAEPALVDKSTRRRWDAVKKQMDTRCKALVPAPAPGQAPAAEDSIGAGDR